MITTLYKVLTMQIYNLFHAIEFLNSTYSYLLLPSDVGAYDFARRQQPSPMSGDEEASGDSSGADLSESMTQAHEREAITRALDTMVQVIF